MSPAEDLAAARAELAAAVARAAALIAALTVAQQPGNPGLGGPRHPYNPPTRQNAVRIMSTYPD